jgi:prepilin-type N-terminal cleavage/methylation domain-containing protein/prepilin-type processing-associated H-X9-DG protein
LCQQKELLRLEDMKNLARNDLRFACRRARHPYCAGVQSGGRISSVSPITPSKHRGGVSGFTLAELLVVIAIIGVLAAMLLSGLSRARGNARSAFCQNNLHKIGIAVQMYVGDNNSIYPNYSTSDGALWEAALQPYYPVNWSNQLTQCPAYTGLLPANATDRDRGGGMVSSYGYNTWGVTWEPVKIPALNYCLGLGVDALRVSEEMGARYGVSLNAALAHHESQVTAPAELYAFMDARGSPITVRVGNNTTQVWAGWDHTDGIPTSSDDYPFLQSRPQHDAYFNVLFCDSHVAAVRVANLFETVPPASHPAPGWTSAHNWNIDNQAHSENWLYD